MQAWAPVPALPGDQALPVSLALQVCIDGLRRPSCGMPLVIITHRHRVLSGRAGGI
jgi:hypothetical protein